MVMGLSWARSDRSDSVSAKPCQIVCSTLACLTMYNSRCRNKWQKLLKSYWTKLLSESHILTFLLWRLLVFHTQTGLHDKWIKKTVSSPLVKSENAVLHSPVWNTSSLVFLFFLSLPPPPPSLPLSLYAFLSLSRSSYFTSSMALSHSLLPSLPHLAPTLSASPLSMLCPLAPSLCSSLRWVSLKSILWGTTGRSSPSTRSDTSLTYAPIPLQPHTH